MSAQSRKLLNIEVPCCNRQNSLFKYFLKGIHYLAPIKDFIDISFNFNGKITDSEIDKCISYLTELGFTTFFRKNEYHFESGKHDVLRIRNDTHKINPNNLPFILFIDDDVEILSEEYGKELLASILWMSKKQEIGSITFNKQSRIPKCSVYPVSMMHSINCTGGGIMLRNIPEWEGIIPKEKQSLRGCLDDVISVYERVIIGYHMYAVNSDSYKHYEHRQEDKYVSGRSAYRWNMISDDERTSAGYLRSNGIRSVAFPNTLWKGDTYWNNSSNVFDFSNLTIEEIKKMF